MDEQTKNKNKNLLIPSLKADRKMNIVQKKRAFPFSSLKNRGSMTVEASMVLPMFLFFMMTLLMGIEIVRLQSNLFAGLGSSETKHVEEQIYRVLQDQPLLDHFEADVVEEYLNGQENGRLCLLGNISVGNRSDVQGNGRIEVIVQYQIKPFIYWLPIGNSDGGGLRFRDQIFVHDFNGYRGPIEGNSREEEEIVYITENGTRYHTDSGCVSLRISVQTVHSSRLSTMRNQSGGRYYPCERCRPSKNGVFFITRDGDRYHRGADCFSLKRTVRAVTLEEAVRMGRTACSKCS